MGVTKINEDKDLNLLIKLKKLSETQETNQNVENKTKDVPIHYEKNVMALMAS